MLDRERILAKIDEMDGYLRELSQMRCRNKMNLDAADFLTVIQAGFVAGPRGAPCSTARWIRGRATVETASARGSAWP